TIPSLLGMSMLLIATVPAGPSSTAVVTSVDRAHQRLTCRSMLVSLPGGKLIPGRRLAHPTANVLCSTKMLETSEACRHACADIALFFQTSRTAKQSWNVEIGPRFYNTQTIGFERPWPFGPESHQQ